jgi:hypothetical protein
LNQKYDTGSNLRPPLQRTYAEQDLVEHINIYILWEPGPPSRATTSALFLHGNNAAHSILGIGGDVSLKANMDPSHCYISRDYRMATKSLTLHSDVLGCLVALASIANLIGRRLPPNDTQLLARKQFFRGEVQPLINRAFVHTFAQITFSAISSNLVHPVDKRSSNEFTRSCWASRQLHGGTGHDGGIQHHILQ